jgi:hypothetical protein
MTQETNTFSTHQAIGNREDLTDEIHMISPTDTPFQSAIRKSTAKAVHHEWQEDALANAVANNAKIEGDAISVELSAPTVRLGNYAQILEKNARVTGTQEAVDKAGRNREMAYQVAKRLKELKRDLESSLLANQARVVGNDSTARRMAGLPTWLTVSSRGPGSGTAGANPVGANGTAAATDANAQRAFLESQVQAVHQALWNEGADPTILMVGPHNRTVASTFTGGATKFDKTEDKKLYATIDVYVGDFGDLKIVPNRFQRAREAFLVDPNYAKLCYLRRPFSQDIAINGDNKTKQIIMEATLEVCNRKAHGVVADLTTA